MKKWNGKVGASGWLENNQVRNEFQAWMGLRIVLDKFCIQKFYEKPEYFYNAN